MSDDSSFWSDLFDWFVDFNGTIPPHHTIPKIESKDGQEPTTESLRAEARQADVRAKTEKPRTLTTHDRKAIDKEFWDTM